MQALINATILTQDAKQPAAEALAIENGLILAAGSTEEILSIQSKEKTILDLQGKTILPGLCDSHIHLGYFSRGLEKVDLTNASRQESLDRIQHAAMNSEQGSWILGHGWDQNLWPEGYGDASLLDSVAPNNPVFLTAKSLHAAWVNTSAMQEAGITAAASDPVGGILLRDLGGAPNGVLLESAVSLVESIIPEPSPSQMAEMIRKGQEILWQMGITAIHDFDESLTLEGLLKLKEDLALQLRVHKNILIKHLPELIEIGLRGGFGDDLLHLGAIKCFMDGAIGPHTAAVSDPYSGSDNLGELLYAEEDLFTIYKQAVDHGFSVATHAIGDRANHALLNVLQKTRAYEKENQLIPARHRIEHAQILAKNDLQRFHELNVIASMQPIHLPMDIHTTDTHLAGRGVLSFQFISLLDNAVILIFGSDAPVASPNPFLGMHAAITRKRTIREECWHPQERINFSQALAAYTIAPAFAAGMENKLGKLTRGHYADLIVLDSNPFTLPADEIIQCQPIATMVGGNWVYSNLT